MQNIPVSHCRLLASPHGDAPCLTIARWGLRATCSKAKNGTGDQFFSEQLSFFLAGNTKKQIQAKTMNLQILLREEGVAVAGSV